MRIGAEGVIRKTLPDFPAQRSRRGGSLRPGETDLRDGLEMVVEGLVACSEVCVRQQVATDSDQLRRDGIIIFVFIGMKPHRQNIDGDSETTFLGRDAKENVAKVGTWQCV